jgi:hypothetical protein
MTLRQQLIRSLSVEGVKPVAVVADQMIEKQLERLAFIRAAAEKIRQWREEDERNGQPWSNQ